MTVLDHPGLEADIFLPELDLDDLPMTEERDAGPFLLALLADSGGGLRRMLSPFPLLERTLAEAPIGMWRLPSRVGDVVRSAWPAHFRGPLPAARGWNSAPLPAATRSPATPSIFRSSGSGTRWTSRSP